MPDIRLPYNYDPRIYQVKCWQHFVQDVEGLRGAAVWHRRAGKDLLGINLVAVKHLQHVGMYWHLLPTYKQGRAIVWNGFTKEGRRFIDHFPKELVTERNKTEMRVTFRNGSMYQVVGTDDVNSLVGTNPYGCIFSEYSLQDPAAWDYIQPILIENGGWALFIYTARGKNHGYKMYQMALKNKKWFCQLLIAGDGGTRREDGTPVVSDQQIQDARDGGWPEEKVQQEFYCSFEAPLIGSYYGLQMAALDKQKRIGKVPWEPRLPVNTAWDLGIDDEMVVWFIQEMPGEIRVIDYERASGESLLGMLKRVRGQTEETNHRQEYTWGKHYAPHDIEVREMTSGKSRLSTAKEHGMKFTVVRIHEVEDRIDTTRQLLPICWFDEEKCEHGVESLKSYRKDWDEKTKTFLTTPLHDWSSHAADAFGIYAMGRKVQRLSARPRQETAIDDHDYLR